VKDHYTLEPQGSEAEVNPALRHHLKQLYDLDLPESICDLLQEKAEEIARNFEPGRQEALAWRPNASNHWFFALSFPWRGHTDPTSPGKSCRADGTRLGSASRRS